MKTFRRNLREFTRKIINSQKMKLIKLIYEDKES